ncbi:nucleotidyltransferase domain-containing protein [bacterium]|nr:nucleotidyltransferase domain-containing protein [bacterium]
MFGLIDRHLDFVKETLKRHIKNPDAKFYIFGSRAKGKYREYSDVDIAIDCPGMTLDEKLRLESDFENSTFPYEVDIVDLNTVKDYFKNLIKDDLIEL